MNRNHILDVMKGLGIVGVVVGHSIAVVPTAAQSELAVRIQNMCGSFRMPLFFIVSGYLMYLTLKGSRLTWIKNKAFYLLVPHFVFNVIYYFLSKWRLPPMPDYMNTISFGRYLYLSVFYDDGEWFLWSLFLVFCFMLIVDYAGRRLKGSWFLIFLVALVAVHYFVYPTLMSLKLLRLGQTMYYIPYCLAGYVIAKYHQKILDYISVRSALLIVPWTIEIFIETFRFSVSWEHHALIVGFYWILVLKGGGIWSRPLEAMVLPAQMYWWFYLTPIEPPFVTQYGLAFTMLSLVVILSWGITKVHYLRAPFLWLGWHTMTLYLFTLGTSNLGFGYHITRMVTNIIGSFSTGVLLTWACSKIKLLQQIGGTMRGRAFAR